MKLNEAKEKLAKAKKRQNKLREEIVWLCAFIRSKGQNPNIRNDYSKRNAAIYNAWKRSRNYREVGRRFSLSSTRIRSICKRMELSIWTPDSNKKTEG